jgi:hypothetical protein
MSWKSLVCAGLLCALAMPVSAAPTLTIDLLRSSGTPVLDAAGHWQWVVSVNGNAAGSMAEQLAFTASAGGPNPLFSAAAPNSADWDHEIPGDVPGTGSFASWAPDDGAGFPEGLDVHTATNELLAAFGSKTFASATNSQLITIKTGIPSTTNGLSSTLAVSGAYTSNSGRIALGNTNYDGYAGSTTVTVKGGNANFDNIVNGLDSVIVGSNWLGTGKIWTSGDFTGDGVVNGLDSVVIGGNWLVADPIASYTGIQITGSAAGAGAGSAAASVPEPASALLLLMAGAMMAIAKGRRG